VNRFNTTRVGLLAVLTAAANPALAGWDFIGSPVPNAFIQAGDMTLEIQCDRIRFSPAAYEDSRDIAGSQGLSIRFISDGRTETGSFQVSTTNAHIGIVDNYPVEIVFNDDADFGFVLEQMSENAVLNLSKVERDVSYGVFSLEGSLRAIDSLRSACDAPRSFEAPEGHVYCGGGAIKRQIEYLILNDAKDQWDARVTVNGETIRAMTSYSFFGQQETPRDFVVALLGENRSEFLVFGEDHNSWIEFGDYTYRPCN
jgi:hypothetical protein